MADIPLSPEDVQYLRPMEIVFDLTIPGKALATPEPAETRTFSYVLPLPVRVYSASNPFTLNLAPGLDGGLTVHENGILMHPIRISGTFGWQPKPMRLLRDKPAATFLVLGGDGVPGRKQDLASPAHQYSGQKHLQFLEDRIFRAYGELKRNPEFAEKTKLVYHNLKTEEHWEVKPVDFQVSAAVPSGNTFNFDINLIAVAAADQKVSIFDINVDGGFLKSTLNAINRAADTIRSAVQFVRGKIAVVKQVVNDTVRAVGSVARAVRDGIKIVEDAFNTVTTVANGLTSVVSAVESIVTAPVAMITAASRAMDALTNLKNTVSSFPSNVRAVYEASLRDANRSFEALTGIMKSVAPSLQVGETFRAAQYDKRTSAAPESFSTNSALVTASDRGPGTKSLAATETGPLSSDIQSSVLGRLPFVRRKKYGAVISVKLVPGSSLRTVARAYIGDETAWRDIAILNKLVPPYITEVGIPGTLRPGMSLYVPLQGSFSVKNGPEVGLLGAGASKTPEAAALGTDFKLTYDSQASTFDFTPAPSGDDLQLHSGGPCVIQDLTLAASVELGQDKLFPNLGMDDLVGTGATASVIPLIRFGIEQFLKREPRIISVERLDITLDGDKVIADAELKVNEETQRLVISLLGDA